MIAKKNDWTLKDIADRQKVSAGLAVHALPFQ
jgi:hypothetical protein